MQFLNGWLSVQYDLSCTLEGRGLTVFYNTIIYILYQLYNPIATNDVYHTTFSEIRYGIGILPRLTTIHILLYSREKIDDWMHKIGAIAFIKKSSDGQTGNRKTGRVSYCTIPFSPYHTLHTPCACTCTIHVCARYVTTYYVWHHPSSSSANP